MRPNGCVIRLLLLPTAVGVTLPQLNNIISLLVPVCTVPFLSPSITAICMSLLSHNNYPATCFLPVASP
jgi:hypothetical protein